MRWKQLVGWLTLCSLFFSAANRQAQGDKGHAPESARLLPAATCVVVLHVSSRAQVSQIMPAAPNMFIRRVAILRIPPSTETRVLDAIERERAMRTNHRRRQQLFAPAPPALKPGAAGAAKGQKGSPKSPDRKADQEPPDDSSLTVKQLQAIGEILFEDSLIDAFHTTLNLQIVPENEVEDALKELGISRESANSADNAERLSARLQCDAIIVPRLLRIRLREGDTRDLAFWASLRVYRSYKLAPADTGNNAAQGPGTPSSAAPVFFTEYPISGSAASERAPFQSRYLKDWTLLIHEAGKEAAAMASQTFLTGIIAPFARQSEVVALIPVESPEYADALIFKSAGRSVIPGALTHLPTDVSARFHPPLLPLFDEAILKSDAVKRALAGLKIAPGSLWTMDEMPDTSRVRRLGMRLKADYILMARIGDLEIAQEMGQPNEAGPSIFIQNSVATDAGSGSPGRPSRQISARAEAIGAFVRVSDGALLWHERTTATSTMAMSAGAPERDTPAARRAVSDAIHFALLQLERRFRQFRNRYER